MITDRVPTRAAVEVLLDLRTWITECYSGTHEHGDAMKALRIIREYQECKGLLPSVLIHEPAK